MAFHPIPSTCTTQEPFTIPTGIFVVYLIIMSISWWFCAGIGVRYLYRRWHRRHKTTSIGRLLDYLVRGRRREGGKAKPTSLYMNTGLI